MISRDDEREVHPLVAHRDAVRDGDRAELERVAAAGVDAVLDRLGEAVEREVARRDLVPRARDADLRLGEVVVAEAHGPEHPPRGGLLETVGDVAAAGLDVRRLRHACSIGPCPLGGHRISRPDPGASARRSRTPSAAGDVEAAQRARCRGRGRPSPRRTAAPRARSSRSPRPSASCASRRPLAVGQQARQLGHRRVVPDDEDGLHVAAVLAHRLEASARRRRCRRCGGTRRTRLCAPPRQACSHVWRVRWRSSR